MIAVQDGKIVKMGRTDRLGKFIQLRDVYGNTYTYGHLKKLSVAYPVPKEKTVSDAQVEEALATLPEREPVTFASSAMVASMPAGFSVWPAVFVAQQAPWHFASDAVGR